MDRAALCTDRTGRLADRNFTDQWIYGQGKRGFYIAGTVPWRCAKRADFSVGRFPSGI